MATNFQKMFKGLNNVEPAKPGSLRDKAYEAVKKLKEKQAKKK